MHHHIKKTKVEKLRPAIEGALRAAIHDHGPVHEGLIASAGKRITGNVKQWISRRDQEVDLLCRERVELRRKINELENALKPFVKLEASNEDYRWAASLLYGDQEWIKHWTPTKDFDVLTVEDTETS